jgi:molybdopterin/thiamine biosynthesis adenylyltransferase
MNDRDFMRYSRQILLDDIALDGQQKLLGEKCKNHVKHASDAKVVQELWIV